MISFLVHVDDGCNCQSYILDDLSLIQEVLLHFTDEFYGLTPTSDLDHFSIRIDTYKHITKKKEVK